MQHDSARRGRRIGPAKRVWIGLALLVLLSHAASLVALHGLAGGLGSVKAFEEPLFTRMLAPEAPPMRAPARAAPAAPPPATVPSLPSAGSSTQPDAPKKEPLPEPPEEPPKPEPTAEPKPDPKVEPSVAQTTRTLAEKAEFVLETLGVRNTATTASAATVVATISVGSSVGGTGTATIDAWPRDTRLDYLVEGEYRGPIEGRASVTWQRTGDKYQVLLNVSLASIIDVKMISQGKVKPNTLWPEVYEEVLSRPRKLTLAEQALAFSDGNTMARPPGVQDTVSQFVELTQRFATGSAKLEEGAVVHVPLARPGGFNDWYYDVKPEPALQTWLDKNYRELPAWHLKPRPVVNARGPITMEFWLVPELQYFPARVRIALDEKSYLVLNVTSIRQR